MSRAHEGRCERTVKSGATLLVLREPSLPVVEVIIASRRGALADPTGKAGRARVLVELLTRGTEAHDRRQWNASIERLGSQVSASVDSDVALLRAFALKRHFAATVDLLTEALLTPAFAEQERDALVAELCETLHSERDDDGALTHLFWRRAIYGEHPLARHTLGEPDDLATLTTEDLRAAQRLHLCAAELVIVCVGDTSLSEVEKLFAPLIAGLPATSEPLPTMSPLPEPSGLDVLLVDKPARTQAQLWLGRLSLAGNHPDVYAFWVGATAFGGTFTSQLVREIRDVRGWSYGVDAAFTRFRPYPASFILRSAPATGDALDCLELTLELYQQVARGELEAGAADFAKRYLLNRYPLDVASLSELGVPVLREELLGMAPDELWQVPARLDAITPEAVGRALASHLDPNRVQCVLVATASDVAPELRRRHPHANLRIVDYREK